jgi:hypothetical protein
LIAIGRDAASAGHSIDRGIFIGYRSGRLTTNSDYTIAVGYQAGQSAYSAENSIYIGRNAGSSMNLSNSLSIHSSSSDVGTNGLIYGEFDNRLLRVNGRLEATNGFLLRSNLVSTIPTLSPGDNFYWSSNGVPHVIWKDQAGTQATNRLVP